MILLSLDVGDIRVGVARCDRSGLIVTPITTLERGQGPASFLRIAEMVREYGAEAIVVGMPYLPDDSEGQQARSTRAYVNGLNKHVTVPILFYDETESSSEAGEIMRQNKRSRRRRKQTIDAVAAAVILQRYLDSQSGEPHL